MASSAQLRTLIAARRPGETVRIDLWRPTGDAARPGEAVSVQVEMGRLEPETNAEGLAAALRSLGFTRLATFTEADADARGVPFVRGVLAQEVAEGAPVAAQIPAGSVITEVFGAPIGSVDELYLRIIRAPALSSRGLDVPVRVRRPDGSEAAVVLPLRPPTR